jgi:two-component system phosphate regulon sensor histidine kinase PhoR
MMQWDYWRLLAIVSVAGFVGLLFGHMMVFMFIASFLYALWMQHTWQKLWLWLQKPHIHKSPNAEGIIDEVCRQIDAIYKQNRSRKKRLGGYIKRFQAATSALPDAVVVLGEAGKVDWANKSAKTLLGIKWPRDSFIRVGNLIRDPEFQKLLNTPVDEKPVAIVTSPLDQKRQLEMKIVSYMGDGRLLIARDMTQTVKLQRMRRDFVTNVSHELRTPLTVLHGYLQTLSNDSPTEQWQSALPVMRQQAQRMNAMITDLLALSQLETGEKPLNDQAINVGDLLNSIAKDAKQHHNYQQHTITMELLTDKLLMADSDELRSAISNLVFNAIKYTGPDCNITLRWLVDKHHARIEVNDNGLGIDEHHLERLTERFYRVDNGRSQEAGGTGLGLAIVKHVLQRHGAELKISSDVGAGSQFCCCFPLSKLVDIQQ